jgi:hypothetical protein
MIAKENTPIDKTLYIQIIKNKKVIAYFVLG